MPSVPAKQFAMASQLSASSTKVDMTDVCPTSYKKFLMADCVIKDRLQARLLLLSDGRQEAIWIGMDNCVMRNAHIRDLKSRIHSLAGIPPERILIASDHIHSGHGYASIDVHRQASLIADGIRNARQSLKPIASIEQRIGQLPDGSIINRRANLGDALGEENIMFNDGCVIDLAKREIEISGMIDESLAKYGTNRADQNLPSGRIVHKGLVDERVHLWILKDASGAAIASVLRINTHPVTVSQSRAGKVVSGDFIRVTLDAIDAELGATSLAVNGSFGNTRPLQSEYSFAERDRVGRLHAETALNGKKTKHPVNGLVCAVADSLGLAFRKDCPKDSDAMRARLASLTDDPSLPPAVRKRNSEMKDALSFMLGSLAPNIHPIVSEEEMRSGVIQTEWQFWRLGPITLFTLPGEPFVEQSNAIEAATGALTAGVANGYIGYIPDVVSLSKGGYETTDRYLDESALGEIVDIARALNKNATPGRR
ncbi:MAG: hypothetical protein ABIH86_00120 [Planctomycetota bacterium]